MDFTFIVCGMFFTFRKICATLTVRRTKCAFFSFQHFCKKFMWTLFFKKWNLEAIEDKLRCTFRKKKSSLIVIYKNICFQNYLHSVEGQEWPGHWGWSQWSHWSSHCSSLCVDNNIENYFMVIIYSVVWNSKIVSNQCIKYEQRHKIKSGGEY